MGSSIFNASLSGMNAAQYQIATTENNIANASTPGYTRQQVQLTPAFEQNFGSGYVGQGVNVTTVRRIYDQYLTSQVLQQQTQASYLSTYQTAIGQVDNLLSNPNQGLSPALQNLFSGMNDVANNPGSIPSLQSFLGDAQTMVYQFQSMSQQLSSIASGLNSQISGGVNSINSYAQQIAVLNNSIQQAIATGQGQMPNALLDQRDQLINQLGQQIQTSVLQQPDGTVSVFIGSGQALVMGNQAMTLQAIPSASNPSQLTIAYLGPNGNVIPLPQNSLQGGTLGAYLDFQNQSLAPAQNALGLLAIGLATSFNQQNQLGQTLNGTLGSALFNVPAPNVIANTGNTGTAAVTAAISNAGALTSSDYQLKFDGTNYSLTNLSNNTVTNLGTTLPQTVDGITINLSSGTPAAGDSFLIQPTINGASGIALITNDPTQIAAAAPILASAATANTGSATISSGTVNPPPPVTPNPTYPLTDLNLQQPVTITFNNPPTSYNVTGTGTGSPINVPYTPGSNISYNGWTVQISGTPSAGDVFNVAANTNAVGDSRNALLMAGLQTQKLMSNGTSTLADVYSQLVDSVGTTDQQMSANSSAQTNMLAQTVASQQAVSGVNLDEEAANLMQYQNAYQASAKAMQVADSLFATLLASLS
ncbi:MAG: flagellar hook-associated protein FlgK [Gallionella sp.]